MTPGLSCLSKSLIVMPDAAIKGLWARSMLSTRRSTEQQNRTHANACGPYYGLPKASTFESATGGFAQKPAHASASKRRF